MNKTTIGGSLTILTKEKWFSLPIITDDIKRLISKYPNCDVDWGSLDITVERDVNVNGDLAKKVYHYSVDITPYEDLL